MSEDYDKARKLGQRSYSKCLLEGKYPYLQVLDEILSQTETTAEIRLGLQQIPADLIVGTLTAGRRTAFAPNYMPLLSPQSEFAYKWSKLCEVHMTEGIHDPIKCYEFMNRYYVEEGNKRVSVLKYCDAVTISGNVTRIIPWRTDDPENIAYFEFLDFYRKSKVNYIVFRKPGCYARLEKLIGKDQGDLYTEEELTDLRSAYVRFEGAYHDIYKDDPPIPVSEGLLVYLSMFSYAELKAAMPAKLREDIGRISKEISLKGKEHQTEIVTEPTPEAPKKSIIARLFTGDSTARKLKIAFLHEKSKETSGWTYSHELGRMYLEEQFPGQVETVCRENLEPGESLERAFEESFAEGCDVIFTTTPQFLDMSIREAVKHPEVRILNCSVNAHNNTVRTYYARLYEAKLLSGMIAGAMSPDGKIGYIADYPINGMIANINAFAYGAQMTNPRARIYLEWSSTASQEEIRQRFQENGVHIVSGPEMVNLKSGSRQFGLVDMLDWSGKTENLAMPVWHWGEMYHRLTRSILDGTFDTDDPDGLALGYWWGMSAGAIELICSEHVPQEVSRLVELVRQDIVSGAFRPFAGTLHTQNGEIHQEENEALPPEQIIKMDWLADNVIGSFPKAKDLSTEARNVVKVQGAAPVEKEVQKDAKVKAAAKTEAQEAAMAEQSAGSAGLSPEDAGALASADDGETAAIYREAGTVPADNEKPADGERPADDPESAADCREPDTASAAPAEGGDRGQDES